MKKLKTKKHQLKKLTYIFLSCLFCSTAYSQKKQTYQDSTELERITNMLNMSGNDLYESAQQEINGWKLIGVGSLISISGGLIKSPAVMFVGGGVSAVSIPLFISSAFSKRKAANKLKTFQLKEPLDNITTIELSNNIPTDNVDSTQANNTKEVEPKYKVGKIIYFYKNDQLTEAKIVLIDTIGLRIEYLDLNKNKTRTKFINFDKVLLEKPN